MWIESQGVWLNLDHVCMIEDTEQARGGSGQKEPALVVKLAHGENALDFVFFGSRREKALEVLNKHNTKKMRADSKSDLRIVSI